MECIQKMLSEKGKPMIVINNYKYNFHKKLCDNIERWQCIKRGCKSYVKSRDDIVVEHNCVHNHDPINESILNRQQLSNSVKRKAIEDICERPAKILHQQLRTCDVDTITVTDVNLIRKCMYNGRRSVIPKIPQNVTDVHDVLNSIEIKTNKGEAFIRKNDSANNFVAFTCDTNLKFLSQMSVIYVDGTFKCCTKYFCQLFTVHGLENDHYIPLAYFLLPNKQMCSYVSVFEFLKNECEKLNLVFHPSFIYADFEINIHKAVGSVFPHAEIKGCRFHLGQSW